MLCKLDLEKAYMLNYHLFQKLKLIGMNKFNNLTYIITLSFTYGLKLSFNMGFDFLSFLCRMGPA